MNQISVLPLITEKTQELRKDLSLYIVFIDPKTAFNFDSQTSLWAFSDKISISDKKIRLIESQCGEFSKRCWHEKLCSHEALKVARCQ